MSHTSNTQTIFESKTAITRAINFAEKVARHFIRNFHEFNNFEHAQIYPLYLINLCVKFSSVRGISREISKYKRYLHPSNDFDNRHRLHQKLIIVHEKLRGMLIKFEKLRRRQAQLGMAVEELRRKWSDLQKELEGVEEGVLCRMKSHRRLRRKCRNLQHQILVLLLDRRNAKFFGGEISPVYIEFLSGRELPIVLHRVAVELAVIVLKFEVEDEA